MLTHFWPGNDRAAAVAAAGNTFPGPVIAASKATFTHFTDVRPR